MRTPRWMNLLALVFALSLFAAACGNDESAGGEEGAGAEGGDTAATEDAGGEMSTEAGTEGDVGTTAEAGDAMVEVDAVCAEEYADAQAPEDFNVGLVTDIGSVDDGTFNQYAYEGMQAASECFDIETDFIETASEADYATNLETILSNEPEVAVTVGFLLADATLAAAQENTEVNFVGVDQFQEEFPENYVGVTFREDQGGYLAGAMAGLMTESNVVGVVGGVEEVPAVKRFVNGFRLGAEAVNPEIDVLEVYNDSFTDPAGGGSDAQQMIGEGADVIFGAGGQTGSGAISTAAQEGAWVIGVDQDEYFTTFSGGSAPGADRLLTSAIKRVDLGVFEQIAQAITGEFTGGPYELTAENGGITYAPFHDADVPEEVATQLEDIRSQLAAGEIDIPLDPATGEMLEG
jgi:basic membrane protein A and related proteins